MKKFNKIANNYQDVNKKFLFTPSPSVLAKMPHNSQFLNKRFLFTPSPSVLAEMGHNHNKRFLFTQSPTVLAKKVVNKYNKDNTKIIFDLYVKTEKNKKFNIYTVYNLTTGLFTQIRINEGSVNIKDYKTFIAETITDLSSKGHNILEIYIPKRASSETLKKIFDLCYSSTKINYYLKAAIKNIVNNYNNYKELRELINNRDTGINQIKLIIDNLLDDPFTPALNNEHNLNPYITKRNYSTNKSKAEDIKDPHGWYTYTSQKHNDFVDEKVLTAELDKFADFYNNYRDTNRNFSVQVILQLSKDQFRTLGSSQITNIKEIKNVKDSLLGVLENKDWQSPLSATNFADNNKPFGTLIFKYRYSNSPTTFYHTFSTPVIIESMEETRKDGKSFKGYPLPLTMDLDHWKGIKYSKDLKSAEFQYNMLNNLNEKYIVKGIVKIDNESATTTFIRIIKGEIVTLFSYTDYLQNGANLNDFKRVITSDNDKTYTYIYQDSKLKFFLKPVVTSFIKPIKKDQKFNIKNIATMDIETRKLKSGLLQPVNISLYIKNKKHTFFIDNKNLKEDMKNVFKSVLKSTHHNTKIFVHNLSGFDGIFILDTLTTLGKIDFNLRNGKIMKLSLKFQTKDNGPFYKINFVDSLLMLPGSLDSLSKAFKVKNKKTHFPLKFLDRKDFNLNYIGNVPPYTDFYDSNTPKFTIKEYEEYCLKYNNNWCLKDELKAYCEQDCVALYEVLESYGNYIFNLFAIDISKCVTNTSIGYKIMRSNFLKDNIIPNITSTKLHNDLKKSYLGGICEVYKGFGENLTSYDKNSLYPYVMSNFAMPVGSPTYIEGDPFEYDPNGFGFFHAQIIAPELDKPFLPKKIQTSGGVRTAFPVGSWEGMYFSEELKNAIKYGYKVICKGGYLFEKALIFAEFIEKLYDIKQSYDSSHPMYFIAKLLMNTLYGRFGLGPDGIGHKIISGDEVDDFILNHENPILTHLPSGNCIASYSTPISESMNLNSCVAISSAIAAYGRIEMSHILVKYSEQIHSIDTDGIKMSGSIDPSLVSPLKLGALKKEYELESAVFLAPKCFAGKFKGEYKNNKEICKIKGYTEPLAYTDLESLLTKDSYKVYTHNKFFKELALSSIRIKDTSYTLKVTSFKRVAVFKNNRLSHTLPLRLKNGVIVSDAVIVE